MAQSELSAPWLGESGGMIDWESGGALGGQPLDLWSRPLQTPLAQASMGMNHTPDRTDIPDVLSAWRAAERQLDDLVEASPRRFLVLSEIARLRAEYQRLFALKIR